MKARTILSALAFVLGTAVSFGQGINSTVEVTNNYQGNAEAMKPQIEMNIPDSLMRFDLDFNYEVFENPYQGSYSFKPYMLNMKPGKDAYRGKSLYVKLGAGYSLHPEFEFVYSPEQKGRFQMSVYGSHKSYFGFYDKIAHGLYENGISKLDKTGGHFKGYDMVSTAGFDGRMNFDNAVVDINLGYYGLGTKDSLVTRYMNAADFSARVASTRDDDNFFYYNIGFDGRVASDKLKYSTVSYVPMVPPGVSSLGEFSFALSGTAGPVLGRYNKVLVDFEGATHNYSKLFDGSMGRLVIAPKYVFRKGRFDFSAGVRFEYLVGKSQADSLSFNPMHRTTGTRLYPDVHVEYEAMKDHLALYAGLGGGSNLNSYSSLIAGNHHITPTFQSASGPFMDNSKTLVDARIGLKGNIKSRLQFDLSAGGRRVENGLVDALVTSAPVTYYWSSSVGMSTDLAISPAVAYVDYSLYYADLLLAWKSRKLTIDAGLHYRSMNFEGLGSYADPAVSTMNGYYCAQNLLKGPDFSGNLTAVYNFTSRVYAGISAQGTTSRSTSMFGTSDTAKFGYRIPGYVDLGVLGGYQMTRKLGIYAKAGNLLNMTIQRNPLYAECGPWFTAGITLSL